MAKALLMQARLLGLASSWPQKEHDCCEGVSTETAVQKGVLTLMELEGPGASLSSALVAGVDAREEGS
jgi:hypothetical protein